MQKSLLKWFKSKENKIESKSTSISSLAPKILTKKKDIKKVKPYLDKLKDTIDTKGINNIALTGGYGSGKSTIIKTFKNIYPEYQYLNISLASFNKSSEENLELEDVDLEKSIKPDQLKNLDKTKINHSRRDSKIQKEELERLLEVSILQQIFYHVRPIEIPESRFKRIINIPDWKIWLISSAFILWILSAILSLKFGYIDKINPNTWDQEKSFDFIAFLVFIITFIGLGLFSKLIVQLFSNSKINKVSIKGELELGDNVNKSVFNEHLEEILYFFEMTPYNVVIIEDLDRFDSTDIFTKLREINILLNNSKLVSKDGKKEINFIYAVGDNLFEDKSERVKFFEYIIPVIPFINSSNADEQLKTLIKDSGLEEDIFSKGFTSDVVTFINDIDMRLLTNIFHEFVIYRNTLKRKFVKKPEELFAIITYKNLNPGDFIKLNKKEGKLYNLINNKVKYTEDFIKNVDEKIQKIEKDINDNKIEIVPNLTELKSIYIMALCKKIPNATSFYLNNGSHAIASLLIDNLFEEIIKTNNFQYYQGNSGYYNSNISFRDVEKEVNPSASFDSRRKIIENKSVNLINSLQVEINNLKSYKSEIESWDLKQIFEKVDINEYLNDFNDNRLIKNLILNGYINENYNDYISLFHGVSITSEDFNFERNVKNSTPTKFNYKLEKIENLIDRIDIKYFKREVILNFDLLDYLGNNYFKYEDKYGMIVLLLSDESDKSVKFIDEYINSDTRQLSNFIEKLYLSWKTFFDYVYTKSNYPQDKVEYYLKLIITHVSADNIVLSQNTTNLKDYISKKSNFLSFITESKDAKMNDKISAIIKKLEIEFESLDIPNESNRKLFDYVYENCHFQINRDNIQLMLELYGDNISKKDLVEANYSTLLSSNCQRLIQFVNSEINTYVKDVFLKIDENIFETEYSITELLNNESLEESYKGQIIQKENAKINDLRQIEELNVKASLLIYKKVVAKWDNILDYYTENGKEIDAVLINYLNEQEVYNLLSQEVMPKEGDFDYFKFRTELLLCNEISDQSYTKLLENSKYTRFDLNFENLNPTKVDYLVNNILSLSEKNYDSLREFFPNKHIRLLEKNFLKFLQEEDKYTIKREEVYLLLISKNITSENKIKFIPKVKNEIIINSKDVSRAISVLLLEKNIKLDFDNDVFENIFQSSISTEDKIKLLNIFNNDLDNTQITDLVQSLGGEYSRLFIKKKQPTFFVNDCNEMLLFNLEKRGLIKKFGVDLKNSKIFRAFANH